MTLPIRIPTAASRSAAEQRELAHLTAALEALRAEKHWSRALAALLLRAAVIRELSERATSLSIAAEREPERARDETAPMPPFRRVHSASAREQRWQALIASLESSARRAPTREQLRRRLEIARLADVHVRDPERRAAHWRAVLALDACNDEALAALRPRAGLRSSVAFVIKVGLALGFAQLGTCATEHAVLFAVALRAPWQLALCYATFFGLGLALVFAAPREH